MGRDPLPMVLLGPVRTRSRPVWLYFWTGFASGLLATLAVIVLTGAHMAPVCR